MKKIIVFIVVIMLVAMLLFIPTGMSSTTEAPFGYWKVTAYIEDVDGNMQEMSIVNNYGMNLLSFFSGGVEFVSVHFKLEAKATGEGYTHARLYLDDLKSNADVSSIVFPDVFGSGYVDIPLNSDFQEVMSRVFDFTDKEISDGEHVLTMRFLGSVNFCGVLSDGTTDPVESINVEQIASSTVTFESPEIPSTPPSISISPTSVTRETGKTATMYASSVCPHGGDVQYRWKKHTGSWGIWVLDGDWFRTSFSSTGTYYVYVQARSTLTGLTSDTVSCKWTVKSPPAPPPPSPPTCGISPVSVTISPNTARTWTAGGTCPEGGSLEYSWRLYKTGSWTSWTSWGSVGTRLTYVFPTGSNMVQVRSRSTKTGLTSSTATAYVYVSSSAQIIPFFTFSSVRGTWSAYSYNGRSLGT